MLQFQDVHIEDDGNLINSAGTVDADTPFDDHINSGSRRVFCTARLRTKQEASVTWIVFDPTCDGKLITVDREDCLKRVVGKTKVARYNINTFFQLVATKFLSFEQCGRHHV